MAVWLDGALYFSTGEGEQKAVNLRGNPHVLLLTGCHRWDEGLDVVTEGDAIRAPTTPCSPGSRGPGRRSGTGSGGTRSAKPLSLIQARLAACQRHGAVVAESEPVTGIQVSAGRVGGVETQRRSITAPVVVDAAGAWVRQVAELSSS